MSWRRLIIIVVLSILAISSARAQWTLQDSNTKADLRGVFNVGKGIAWASGTDGTVLRTEDGGYLWQRCAVPPGGEHLDFRAVQAADDQRAWVMSSGKGVLSRVYETRNGCRSWKLLFTNPDADGFWDAMVYDDIAGTLFILGDPVKGEFRLWSRVGGKGKFSSNWNGHPIKAAPGQAAFAASNSLFAMSVGDGSFSFITGGSRSEIIHEEHGISHEKGMFSEWSRNSLPFAAGESSGAFSMAAGPYDEKTKEKHVIVVGGDYRNPDERKHTAAYSEDWGYEWHEAQTPPGGYRSAVAYDAEHKVWIAVGPNGTDISRDDGRNWTSITKGDEGTNWNALSLPFVVGPKGRIGKLRKDVVVPGK